MHKPTIAFTCDDISPKADVGKLRELLSIIDRFDVAATLFVIPKSRSQWNSHGSITKILKEAHANGHEIGLHGLSHYPFETWNPLNRLSRRYLHVREKVSTGLQVIREKLEANTRGYRAPYYQTGRSLLQALDDLNFLYDSSRIALTKAFVSYVPPLRVIWFSRGRELATSKMFRPLNSKLWEIPVTHEFTWYNSKFEVNCFRAFLQKNTPQTYNGCIVVNSHVQALNEWGLRILREFFLYLREEGLSDFTLQQIAEKHAGLSG